MLVHLSPLCWLLHARAQAGAGADEGASDAGTAAESALMSHHDGDCTEQEEWEELAALGEGDEYDARPGDDDATLGLGEEGGAHEHDLTAEVRPHLSLPLPLLPGLGRHLHLPRAVLHCMACTSARARPSAGGASA